MFKSLDLQTSVCVSRCHTYILTCWRSY